MKTKEEAEALWYSLSESERQRLTPLIATHSFKPIEDCYAELEPAVSSTTTPLTESNLYHICICGHFLYSHGLTEGSTACTKCTEGACPNFIKEDTL